MSPRWRKVLHDLWNNKTRTLLVVLSIAVGIYATGTIAGTQVVLSREVTRVYAASHPASATLTSTFDEDFVKAVRRMPEVADAEGRREVTVRAKVGDELRTLLLIAVPDFDDLRINTFRPQSGAWPPPKREMLLERSALASLRASVGDQIAVELFDGTERSLRVAGLTYDFQSPPPILGGTSYGYIDMDTLEWLGFPRNFNRLNVVVAQDALDQQHIQDVADKIKDRAEKDGRIVTGIRVPTPGKPALDNAVQSMLLILGVLGALSLLASGFLIVNTISALLAQHVRQIGVMKAVGAHARQIVAMYLGMVLAFGILALGVALPLGMLSAQWLSQFGARLLNVDIADLSVPAHVIALQAAIGLAVPVLASLYPVLVGTRITVQEAINSYGVSGHFGESMVDRAVARVRGLSRPLLLSLRNTFRRKGRLAFTLTTLTLGGAIFVGVFCVRDALLHTLADSQRYWNFNVAIYFSRLHSIEQVRRQALAVPGVLQAEAWGSDSAVRIGTGGTESRSFNVIAPPAGTRLIKPIVLQGRWLRPDDTNALVINTDMFEDHPDLKVGDTVRLKLDERAGEWQVVGVVRGVLTGRTVYMNYAAYARAARQPGRASSVMVVTDQSEPDAEAQTARALEEHFKRAGLYTSSTSTTSSGRATFEYQFGLLITFLVLMAILLAVVGGLGLMGTMSINVLERIREIGVMRAIGASTGAIMRIILSEGVFIGLLSWLLGAVLALPIGHYLGAAIGTTLLRERLSDTFSLTGAGLWLLVVGVISTLASFLPAWRAARLSVREVLSYE
ncbi:MAG: FtsX-like permease family protein [Chloroflexi bacterium]|nr:FtsX-like permease family protein [Chloroflexota bacterium]